jgi:aminopeptidase N
MQRALIRSLTFITVASLAAGCGNKPPTPAVAADTPASSRTTTLPDVPPEPAPRDDGRLPKTVVPERYQLALRVTPADERFSGVATIAVKVAEPTFHVVLHGRNLHITRVAATVSRDEDKAGAKPLEKPAEIYGAAHARVAHGGKEPEELVLTFAEPLPAGSASLRIEYDAPFDSELSGLYRVKEKDKYYAFTQFEATYARRAFPSFDEPGYKTPYDLSIRAPAGLLAIANTKEIDRVVDGDGTVFKFATTKPLPSYLIAFGVGDFDVREGPKSPVPIRAITVKGKQDLAALAIDATAKLTASLGDYFGIPYPYDKLDVVAIPDFLAGAMENPGFVTFREELLLLSDKAPKKQKRDQAQVIAHELAHQWFGDLVTAAWWDDLFLNEGFATWMEDVAVDRVYPDFGAHLDSVENIDSTFNLDALASTRAIRQPVSSSGEALEAFDGITYEKGAAVLSMLESYLGKSTFQLGVRDYLTKNAWKNATAKDLLASLETASRGAKSASGDRDARSVSAVANQFLDRPGVPLVKARLSCETKPAKYTLSFELAEWIPLGSKKKPSPTWTVPVCYSVAGAKAPECVELSAAAPVTKDASGPCPAWVSPNADARGYYRFALDKAAWQSLAKAAPRFDVPNRIVVLTNAWAQVRSGDLDTSVVLDMLPAFDADHERHVVGTIVTILSHMSDGIVDDASRAAFESYVRARLGGHARAYAAKKTLSADDVLGKRAVDAALANLGNDTATLKAQETVAKKWLQSHGSVDADAAQVAVELASRRENDARFQELVRAMNEAKEPTDRVIALRGLGGFDDPALIEKAFHMVVSGEIKEQDVRYLFRAALARKSARANVAAFVTAHWDELRKRLPGEGGTRLVHIVGSSCKRDEVEKLYAFVAPRAKEMEGADRELDEAVEEGRLCVELHDRAAPAATQFFAKKR